MLVLSEETLDEEVPVDPNPVHDPIPPTSPVASRSLDLSSLGYRAIMLNTGTFGGGCMEDEDFKLFDDWLLSVGCNANLNRQVLMINGGVGNRFYSSEDGLNNAAYAQVTRSAPSGSGNFPAILDGVSWHQRIMTGREGFSR